MNRRLNRRLHGRFDDADAEPLGPLANLADIMLVFVCGLLVALVARGDSLQEQFGGGAERSGESVDTGEPVNDVPRGNSEQGSSGYEPVGRVVRDPDSGDLILIEENEQ
ncbi:MAG: DUF2149 domain-containing protein [Pseudomonadota bacterium]